MTNTWDPTSPFDPDPVPVEWLWERLRNERNRLLAESDWTQVADAPVDQAAWASYRQSLRDLPDTTTDPREAVWPSPPAV